MSKLGGGGSGLRNKPAGRGASEAYTSGPDGKEEEGLVLGTRHIRVFGFHYKESATAAHWY